MAGLSHENGARAETALAQHASDDQHPLHRQLRDALNARSLDCRIELNKLVKPDLILVAESEDGSTSEIRASVKSSLSENGGSGHAARMTVAESLKVAGMPKSAVKNCLALISNQEYEFVSPAAAERAKSSAADVPARELARLSLMGDKDQLLPDLLMLHVGAKNPRILFGPVEALLALVPEVGAEFVEPKSCDSYPSLRIGGGLFSLKRSGGTAGCSLQTTISTGAVLNAFDMGRLPDWQSCDPAPAATPPQIR